MLILHAKALFLGLGSHIVFELIQFSLSSLEIHNLTLLPDMLVMATVHRGVGTLSDKTRLEKGKVDSTSISPLQWNLVFLHVILGDCG